MTHNLHSASGHSAQSNILVFPTEKARPPESSFDVHNMMAFFQERADRYGSWPHNCPDHGPSLVRIGADCIACGRCQHEEPEPPEAA